MKKVIFTVFIILLLPLVFQSYPLQILKLQTFDTFVKEYEPSVVNIIKINNKSILIIIDVFLLKEGCFMIYFLLNLLFNTLLDFTIILSCVNYVMINIFYIIFGNNIRKCCHSILTVNSIVNNFIK